MLELFLALKYLKVGKRSFSSSLIALASVFVIALVVCLLLAFFSITANMEKKWLEKITALSAPLRVVPTESYYNSYYYQLDSAAEKSNFTLKSLGEKIASDTTDPTDLEIDDLSQLIHLNKENGTNGSLKDLAKELKEEVDALGVDVREFNVTGGGMRLRLIRAMGSERMQSFLSAVPYFFGVEKEERRLGDLFVAPNADDFDNLIQSSLSLSDPVRSDNPMYDARASNTLIEKRISQIVSNLEITELQTKQIPWRVDSDLLPNNGTIKAWKFPNKELIYLKKPHIKGAAIVDVRFDETSLYVGSQTYSKKYSPLLFDVNTTFRGSIEGVRGEKWHLSFTIDGLLFQGWAPIEALHIASAREKMGADQLWATAEKGVLKTPSSNSLGMPILLPKTFREKGARLGDMGYLSYNDMQASGAQEQRLDSYICGFYDPGLSPLAGRIILVPKSLVTQIAANTSQYDFDHTFGNGILLWGKDISETASLKEKLQNSLANRNLDTYFRVEAFTDYEFTRPFLKQFASDRQLFTLISGLVLIVACCNVFSFLILLVNDKRSDIAILGAMGASKRSITGIFCLCSFTVGLAATVLGTLLAALFLYKLPALLNWLTFLQAHPAFSSDLFGTGGSVPLDPKATLITCIGVPLISLLAGLIAARRAAHINPTEILRAA